MLVLMERDMMNFQLGTISGNDFRQEHLALDCLAPGAPSVCGVLSCHPQALGHSPDPSSIREPVETVIGAFSENL
jgi:hypothetical protein